MTALPFRSWSRCESPDCDRAPTYLIVVRDVRGEWPELVDGDGAVRFVVCDEHEPTLPAVARGSDGRPHDVERFPT